MCFLAFDVSDLWYLIDRHHSGMPTEFPLHCLSNPIQQWNKQDRHRMRNSASMGHECCHERVRIHLHGQARLSSVLLEEQRGMDEGTERVYTDGLYDNDQSSNIIIGSHRAAKQTPASSSPRR